MSDVIKWSEVPAGLKRGIGVGLAACVAALLVPFEIKMVFFVASLFVLSLGFRDQAVKSHFRLGGFETVADESDPGPHPFTTGLALGMTPISAATIGFALWKWFDWKFVGAAAAILAVIVFQEKIREFYYAIADRISEAWYGSKAQRYFLDHEAGVCVAVGLSLLVISLAAVISMAVQPSFLNIATAVVCMIVGTVISFIGIGIKSAEGG